MSDSTTLSDNVYLQHAMPLNVQPLTAAPTDSELVSMNEHNEKVLTQLLAMDSMSTDSAEDDAEKNADLIRVEQKLDLLLDLAGIMVEREFARPDDKNVTLYAGHLEWLEPGKTEYRPGQWLELHLWLRPDYPRFLRLYVQLEQQSPGAPAGQLVAGYYGLNSQVIALLEKIIFRHHRRVIALSRQN